MNSGRSGKVVTTGVTVLLDVTVGEVVDVSVDKGVAVLLGVNVGESVIVADGVLLGV